MKITDLKTFFNLIDQNSPELLKPNNIHLFIHEGYVSPEDCKGITKALSDFPSNSSLDLHLDFSYYPAIQSIAIAIAAGLEKGKYPAGLKINLDNESCKNACAIALAQALESGNCRLPLSIFLRYVFDEGVKALVKALTSGKCPNGLHLNISAGIGKEDLKELVAAIQNPQCPQNLSLRLNCSHDDAAKTLASAFQSGKCQRGLHVELINYHNTATIMAEVFESGQLPPGFHFKFSKESNAGAALLANTLEKAFIEKKLPAGFGISFDSLHSPHIEISNRIKNVLKANEAWHAAQACITLQQGYRQIECLLFILNQDVLNTIYSYIIFSSIQPFFEREEKRIRTSECCVAYSYEFPYEKVEKEQKIFINKLQTLFFKPKLLESGQDSHSPDKVEKGQHEERPEC
ncbi:hypothetical protein ACFORL_10360 [Legionella dresdenensis]|uniref:Uncharacterized protein n=1 Tax=Legionella dresdenensis TaxID=450200 RepID=A0ABV8CHK7_9GAMM